MNRNIGISTRTADVFGAAVLRCDPQQAQDNYQGRRRATRTPTLDGGAVMYDAGYSVSDRDLVITTSLAHADWLARIVKLYSQVMVTCAEGAYLAVPRRWWTTGGRAHCEFLLLEDLTV